MIHHISISAKNPLHVAKVLAEICHGKVTGFPPHPGSYVVLTGDEYGSMIEIYPLGTELMPGDGDEQAVFVQHTSASRFTATHAAISIATSQEQIQKLVIVKAGVSCAAIETLSLMSSSSGLRTH